MTRTAASSCSTDDVFLVAAPLRCAGEVPPRAREARLPAGRRPRRAPRAPASTVAREPRATRRRPRTLEVLNNDRQFLAFRLPEGATRARALGRRRGEEAAHRRRRRSCSRSSRPASPRTPPFRVAIVYTPSGQATRGDRHAASTSTDSKLPAYEESSRRPFQALLTWSVLFPGDWEVTGFDGNVVPAREGGTTRKSWVYARHRHALGGLVRPAGGPAEARSLCKSAASCPSSTTSFPSTSDRGRARGAAHQRNRGRQALHPRTARPGAQIAIRPCMAGDPRRHSRPSSRSSRTWSGRARAGGAILLVDAADPARLRRRTRGFAVFNAPARGGRG